MSTFKAHVQDGRLILDTPTDLPDGTEVELVPVKALDELDEGDELDDAERERLHDSLRASAEDVARGRVRPADEVLTELFGS